MRDWTCRLHSQYSCQGMKFTELPYCGWFDNWPLWNDNWQWLSWDCKIWWMERYIDKEYSEHTMNERAYAWNSCVNGMVLRAPEMTVTWKMYFTDSIPMQTGCLEAAKSIYHLLSPYCRWDARPCWCKVSFLKSSLPKLWLDCLSLARFCVMDMSSRTASWTSGMRRMETHGVLLL